jgi:hypothetical protein
MYKKQPGEMNIGRLEWGYTITGLTSSINYQPNRRERGPTVLNGNSGTTGPPFLWSDGRVSHISRMLFQRMDGSADIVHCGGWNTNRTNPAISSITGGSRIRRISM